MEFNKELIERVLSYEKTKQIWRTDSNSVEFREANKVNQELFGEKLKPLSGCECLPLFYFNLKRLISNNKLDTIMEKQFVLRRSSLIQSMAFQEPITYLSSDEDCIKLLQLNPKHISKFEKYPKNWEEIVFGKTKKEDVPSDSDVPSDEVESTEIDLNQLSIKQLKKHAQDLGIELVSNKKADIIEEIKSAQKVD